MQNINDLRNSLLKNYNNVLTNKVSIEKSKEITSTAGKILGTLKVELDYNKIQGNKKKIKFLEVK
jgi:hypothetical protein